MSGCFGTRRARRLRRARGSPACFCSAAATARRPSPSRSCRADSSSSASSEPACASMPSWRSPIAANRAGIVTSVKSRGSQSSISSQSSGAETRASGVGRTEYARGDRAILRVLVVVDEDAVAFFLPPLARRERRRAAFDFARERQRGAAHLVNVQSRLDPHVDVHAARSRRLRPPDQAEVVERGADDARRLRGSETTRRPAPDRDRRAARRDDRDRRPAPDAGAARGRPGWPSTTSAAAIARHDFLRGPAGGKLQRDDLDPVGPRLGRALLIEELAADAVGVAHEHIRPSAGRRAAPRRRQRGSSARDRASCDPGVREQDFARIRDRRSRVRRPSGSREGFSWPCTRALGRRDPPAVHSSLHGPSDSGRAGGLAPFG